MTDNDFSCFTLRMIFIQEDKCKWIIKDGTGLVKANTVFPVVVLGFLGVPFEYQAIWIHFHHKAASARAIHRQSRALQRGETGQPIPNFLEPSDRHLAKFVCWRLARRQARHSTFPQPHHGSKSADSPFLPTLNAIKMTLGGLSRNGPYFPHNAIWEVETRRKTHNASRSVQPHRFLHLVHRVLRDGPHALGTVGEHLRDEARSDMISR